MNQRSPQPVTTRLDAEERALAKALPRLHGRTTPDPDLDASILAAAQSAVQPARPSQRTTRPGIRWIAPASLAASVMLAVGMAWHLRPLPALDTAPPTEQSDTVDAAAVRMIESDSYDKPVPMKQSKPAPARSAAPARQQANSPAVDVQEASSSPTSQAGSMHAPSPLLSPPARTAPLSPPAPPAPPAPAAVSATEPASRAGTVAGSSGDTLNAQGVDRGSLTRHAVPATAAANPGNDAIARDAASASAGKAAMTERVPQAAPKLWRRRP